MSDFVSWWRHLLVPFFFMKWHPYIPLHFIEMIFPLVPLIFHSFGALRRAHVDLCTRMRTRTTPPFYARVMHAHVMASFSVCPWRAPPSTVGIYGERKTIAWCPCTPPSTVETFGEEISAEACSGKEIAGLLRKIMMMMMNMMTRKLWNRVGADSRVANWRQVGTS